MATYRLLKVILLSGLWLAAGCMAYGQNTSRAARKRHIAKADSLQSATLRSAADTLSILPDEMPADSIAQQQKQEIERLTSRHTLSEPTLMPTDSLRQSIRRATTWRPNPVKATWLALLIPGGGQIYNRKYWKLPIVYGGFAGCAYALTWNGKTYKDYSNAYRDAANDNWESSNITDLLPPGYINRVSKDQLKNTLKKRKDTYRRYRDMSIFATIGVYLLSVIDAYVDAELSNFDLTPDLSLRIEPVVMPNSPSIAPNRPTSHYTHQSVGMQCSFRF